MAVRHPFSEELDQVLFEGSGSVKTVVLNRPKKLNSLSYHMISQMTKKLKEFENDPQTKIVILKGNGKAFCAGGDIISIHTCMVAGHWSFGAKFMEKQLMLDYLLATYRKNVVALLDGIVMGGGAGLSMNLPFRVVTENTVFTMPEAALGHFPDVGSSYFLSRLPGYLGEYLGLSGARLNGAEMVECGLATDFVLSKNLRLLEDAICGATSFDPSEISQLIGKFVHRTNSNQDGVYSRLKAINKSFSKRTVEEILLSLEGEVNSGAEKWIVKALNSMKATSPTSLKITLRSIREGRTQGLEQCLIREYTIFCNIKRRTVSNDFYEGMRAMLLEKDMKPKWDPWKLELVSDAMVEKCFSGVDEDDWKFLQLPFRPKFDYSMHSKL